MDNAKTVKSSKFRDRVSGWSKAETAANSTLVKYINTIFGKYILPGDTLLDFGCGTGTITLRMARHAHKVYGVDFSEGMLKRAQQNRINQAMDNANFLKITSLDEMFQHESFEVITIFNVLQYIENRKELVEKFYQLLKPQGILIVAVPCFGGMNSSSALFVKFLRFVGIMPQTYFFGVEEIEKEIMDSGFVMVEGFNLSNLPEKVMVVKKTDSINR